MSFQNENIGMMDEGYFVSRGDILKWLNDVLQLNLTKIEQLGSGAVYCQVIDVVHPGIITMSKVNWKAKNDYQFIQNYRLLQDAFKKIGIKRYVQVQKLAKAKYQDNLEFSQWLKRYYDLNCGDRGNNYLAQERRGGTNPEFGFAEKNVVPKTYNGTGQIIPKKEVSPPQKKQKPVEAPPKKVISTIPKAATRDVERPKKIEKVAPKQQKGSPSHEAQDKQLLKKVKEMEEKMMMISQIVKSGDSSTLKIQMIAQLMEIQLNFESEEHEHNEHEQYHEQVQKVETNWPEQHEDDGTL